MTLSLKSSESIFSKDRRINKIEKICHCKIKVDTVNLNVCKTLLSGYHLFEVFYDELKGNHTGCVYMLKELLNSYGHIQAAITITKSQDGKLYRKNSMSEDVKYQLYHGSSYHASKNASTRESVKMIISAPTNVIRSSVITSDSYRERDNLSLQVIEENLMNSEEASSFTEKNGDKPLEIYTITKPFDYDSKQHGVVVKISNLDVNNDERNSTKSLVDDFVSEVVEEKCRQNLSFYDDFVSVLSSSFSDLSSTASSFEDALSRSVAEVYDTVDCHDVLAQLDYEILYDCDTIHRLIDDLARDCFDENLLNLKTHILNSVNVIKFIISQYITTMIGAIVFDEIARICDNVVEIGNEIFSSLKFECFTLLNERLCSMIRSFSDFEVQFGNKRNSKTKTSVEDYQLQSDGSGELMTNAVYYDYLYNQRVSIGTNEMRLLNLRI